MIKAAAISCRRVDDYNRTGSISSSYDMANAPTQHRLTSELVITAWPIASMRRISVQDMPTWIAQWNSLFCGKGTIFLLIAVITFLQVGLFLSGTVCLAILLTFPRCQNSKRVCF